ncbi:MAG: ADP-ribosylglycohydrolase family protein [Candidatus Eremiobacteraeota bacterium]|nr:ADP-ribosylglycohydrolase family protein [Candidatus Eremiobacteraeota bacterium]
MAKVKHPHVLRAALAADSLAMTPHWIYDPDKILERFGVVDHLMAPPEGTYHHGQPLGGQTHLGHQTIVLARTLEEGWNRQRFEQNWRAFWADSTSYKDKATKNALEGNLGASDELGGASRIGAVIAAIDDSAEAQRVAAEQASLTHNAEVAQTAAQLTALAYSLLEGQALEAAVRQTFANHEALKRAEGVLKQRPNEALGELGRDCSLRSALPSVLYFLLTSTSLRQTLIDNVMAGGDSAARGLVLGSLLAASMGPEAIPRSWLDGLQW